MSTMFNQRLVNFLKDCGVCQICQLRFLRARGNEYKDLKESFERLKVSYDPAYEETAAKKQKIAVCPCCMGLFAKEFQAQLIERILKTDINNYECNDIVVAMSMPLLVQIRQLSMWFALIERFGSKIDQEKAPDVPLKEAVKLIINPIVCENLKKNYDANGIMINIQVSHVQEAEDIEKLKQLHDKAFPIATNRKKNLISRGVLEKQYNPNKVEVEMFKRFFPVPPQIVSEPLILESIHLTGPTVFLAGRYRKFSRELSHTPWVLHGQRVMADSIEEIIMRAVIPHFCNDSSKAVFMSSGREDVDVRCLGKGRPFALEIPNSFRTTITVQEAYHIEREIEKSKKLSVCSLQMVKREELIHIKSGEEQKKKYYRALCILQQPATAQVLKKLNLPEGFEIKQKTPIRVLHRRPLHTRPRMIYHVKAMVHKEDLKVLIIDVISQAGTYIKELIHGEFGRTTPSIASIIGQHVDIIALDVMAIDLDWPKEIDNSLEAST